MNTVVLSCVVEMEIALNGFSLDSFINGLEHRIGSAVANGLLTGDSEASVESHSTRILSVPESHVEVSV